jgi:Mg/Co/Ni transporter MgtE
MWRVILRHVCIGTVTGTALATAGYVMDHLPYQYNGNFGDPTLVGLVLTFVELIAAVPWSLLAKPVGAHLPWFLILNGTIVGLLSGLITVLRISRKANHRDVLR